MEYTVILHPAEEGGYWAEVPALPGRPGAEVPGDRAMARPRPRPSHRPHQAARPFPDAAEDTALPSLLADQGEPRRRPALGADRRQTGTSAGG